MKSTTENKDSQIQKFRRLARELGCDESEERFDAALKVVAKQKPKERSAKLSKKTS